MKRLAEWGSGTKCRGGAVRRTAGNPRWFPGSLRSRPLPASGGTPPFRCCSTGERCWTALPLGPRISPPTKRLAEWGSGTKCRGGAVRRTAGNPRWFPGALRSRPLPASGGAPPFRCRSTGEGCWRALPLGQRISPPRSGQRRGGVARSAEGVRSVGPHGTHGGFGACSRVPLELHGGEVLAGDAAGAEDFRPRKRLGEWGSGTRGRGCAVRRAGGNPRLGSWLASLAPPPRLRRCSPVPLPLHGGEV